MKNIWFFLVLLIFIVPSLSGDGGIIPHHYEEIYETGQTAFITFKNNKEALMLLVEVSGEETEFMWLFPCPSLPEVDSANSSIFYDLAVFSAPRYVKRGWEGCCESGDYYPLEDKYGGRGEDNGVDPIYNGSVGFLNYEVLYVTESESLVSYLEDNEYSVPSNAEEIFQFYINKNWNYFIAAVCDTENANWSNYGTNIQPLKISFSTNKPVYPLRISRIGSIDSEIVIYIVANHKKIFTDAEVKFAKRIDEETLNDLYYYYLKEFLWSGSFLTKCYAFIEKASMDDLVLEDAPDNEEFREIHFYSSYPADTFILVCVFGLFWFYKKRVSKFNKLN
ncbi:MAG: DUF2330 domain-containing protein [Candidatus Cloacimonadota bacterium]|nr:MAG: DUF2330 domain-containing protein [Candidatus Cloacimonadota bacterium]